MITINGTTYSGNNITVRNNKVIIDGVEINTGKDLTVNIYVEGNIDSINGNVTNVTVHGNVIDVETVSGDVVVTNSVEGDVQTVSGDVKANSIKGKVKTVSGDIKGKTDF